MKVSIIMAGPYRGNQTIIDNHLKIVGNYDTYVSCFEQYKEDWINSGWPIKKIFTTPNIDFKETNWSKYRDDAPGQSGFWQFWNLKNVINNIEEDYDWYIKSRSDLDFQNGQIVPHMFTTLKKNTLYSSTHTFHGRDWDVNYLLNDQFYIGDSNTMNVISTFVTKYYNKKRHGLNDAGLFVGSNESSLREYLKENGIDVLPLHNIIFRKNHNGIDRPSGESGTFQLETI
jgi:hypothetical protein